jgi:flagellin-specific chaperone FliS
VAGVGVRQKPDVGVRQKLDKEMTMIAALKQHYEHYHAGDLTALKKLYEYHAENCVKAAELTEDTQQREEYLKLAREWTEAARSALDMNALDTKYRRNTRATDISDEMRAAVVEARGRSLRTSWSPRLSPTSP